MKFFLNLSLLLIICTLSFAARIDYEDYQFGNASQNQLFHKIIQQTRCVVCQGQSVADSNAPIAVDMRNKIFKLIKANKNEIEVNEFLVKRYGEFILLEPPVKTSTVILWIFPALILLLAGGMLFRSIKNGL